MYADGLELALGSNDQSCASPRSVRSKTPAANKPERQGRVRKLGVHEFMSGLGAQLDRGRGPWQPAETGSLLSLVTVRLVRRGLEPAQLNVMSELAGGHSNKAIVHRLGIAEPTVKAHASAILRTLGVINRGQAILALRIVDTIWSTSTPRSSMVPKRTMEDAETSRTN